MYYLKQTEHKGEQKEVNINIDWLDKFDKQYKKFHKDNQKEARGAGGNGSGEKPYNSHALHYCRKTCMNAVAMAFAATALCGSREIEEKAATTIASGNVIAPENPGFMQYSMN